MAARRWWTDAVVWVALATAVVSCGVALAAAWRWPLVGDASLMRYVVFLLHSGMAPYREIVDVNLPGSYALEAAAMGIFGAGAMGLRLYDGALCGVVLTCAVVLSDRGWRGRVCGGMAGLLFVTIHLRDGVVQAGQRDLAMAALALLGLVLLLRVMGAAAITGFELLVGLTLVIKPTLFLLAFLPVFTAWVRRERLSWSVAASGVCALFAPAAVAGWWLWRWGSLGAFWGMLSGLERTHAELAGKGFGFLLSHAMAPVAALLVLALVVWGLSRFGADAEWKVLAVAAGCGLVSFVLQRKGFPYQRYAFLALALMCAFRMVARGLERTGWTRWMALATIGLSCFWFAPRFAWRVTTFDRRAPFMDSLSADLRARGVGAGDVQCLDTVGGCVATLNRLGVRQSTGYLYDCYAYVGSDAARAAYRRSFLNAVERSRPRVLVMSSQYCLGVTDDAARVGRWPEMERLLAQRYRLDASWMPAGKIRWWNEVELPPSYQIFVRR
jgi:hypothetical protein